MMMVRGREALKIVNYTNIVTPHIQMEAVIVGLQIWYQADSGPVNGCCSLTVWVKVKTSDVVI